MEQVLEKEELIKKYLLRELTEDEQTEVEILFFTDDEYFDELRMVENELTDDFVFGTLSDHEQERTREYFLNVPGRHQKLRFTKTVEQYISEFPAEDALEITREDILAESQENRYLLGSLIESDWMGLRLLSLLRSARQSKLELVTKVEANDTALTPILIRLIECGVIEEQGDAFFCTKLGAEILAKMEEVSDMKTNP